MKYLTTALEAFLSAAMLALSEAEGSAICHTYFDVAGVIPPKYRHDKTKYPSSLPGKANWKNGCHWAARQIQLSFVCVGGDFDVLRDTYHAFLGREVAGAAYADAGQPGSCAGR